MDNSDKLTLLSVFSFPSGEAGLQGSLGNLGLVPLLLPGLFGLFFLGGVLRMSFGFSQLLGLLLFFSFIEVCRKGAGFDSALREIN